MTRHAGVGPGRAAATPRLRAGRIVPTLAFGLVVGMLEVVLALSFAALVFAGPLAVHLGAGIGLALVSATLLLGVVSLRSSLPGVMGSVQDSTAAVTALVAAGIAARLAPTAETTFLTIVVAIGLTTVATGAFLLVLGTLRLGNLIRFMPYPVVGGFLAGTGLLLARGGLGALVGEPVGLSTLPELLSVEPAQRWVPGLLLALALVVGARRWGHVLLIPGLLLAALVAFYGVAAGLGADVSELEAGGWLVGPLPDASFWEPWTLEGLGRADWGAIAAQAPEMGTVVLVGAVALLLNTSGIELAVDRDLDLNRELRASGGANLLVGLGGGLVGFQALSLTMLATRSGAGRAIGLAAGGVCLLALFLGASVIGLMPRLLLGGLLLFLGLVLLVEWLYDAWWRLPRADYAVVVLILGAIAGFGFLEGVGVGLVVIVALFVVDYSRTDFVKHAFSGGSYRSNVDRAPRQLEVIRDRGDELFAVELQGFLFFGSANSLVERIRARALDASLSPLSFLVLDFRRVSGLDSSAVLSFVKAHRLAQAQGFELAVAKLSSRVRAQLARGGFSDSELAGLRVFPDLDHALQWWEDRLLERNPASAPGPRPLAELLRDGVGIDVEPGRLLPYLQVVELAAGEELMRQGDVADDVYLLESGRLSTVLVRAGGERVRLRTMTSGTIVGEIAMYLGSARSASVVAEEPCRLLRLPASAIAAMERDDPQLAGALHRALARLLAQRLTDSLRTVEALLD